VVTEPNGTKTAYVNGADSEVVKDSTGNYHSDISGSSDGRWYSGWYGTGTGQAAAEDSWIIEGSNTTILSGIYAKEIPASRTLVLSGRRDPTEAEISGPIRMKPGEQYAWRIDFANTQLSRKDLINGMSAPVVGGDESANCTINASEGTGWGVAADGQAVLVELAIDAEATSDDEIYITITVEPEPGDVFIQRVPVDVIAVS
jgi:hypothetical protein